MRQRHFDHFGAGVLEPFDAAIPHGGDFGVQAIGAIFLGNTDLLALEIARQIGFPLRNRQIEAGRILGIEARHDFQQDRIVAHGARHRPGLVQRTGEGDDAEARAAAIGWLDAADAGEGGGLADRATSVGAGRRRAEPRGNGRGGTARRTAGRQCGVIAAAAPPGRDHIAIIAGLVGRTHGELVEVELAQHARAGRPQLARHGRFIGRHEAFQHVRRGGGLRAFGAEQVLHADRHASQLAQRLAGGLGLVGRVGRCQRLFGRLDDEGVQRLGSSDIGIEALGHFARRKIARAEAVADFRNRQISQISHYSITLGTAKKPCSACGALASTLSRTLPSVTTSSRRR